MGAKLSPTAPRVVIIGGGYAGITAAQALDATTRVTVIERRATLNHNMANLRCIANPGFATGIEIPYTNALKNGRVVRGEVVAVRDGAVHLADGQSFPYEYVIAATGSAFRPPGKAPGVDLPSSLHFYQNAFARCSAAAHITIVGGGPVGIELAGELRAAFPKKKILVLNSGATLLHTEKGLTPKFHAKLNEKLALHNIEVMCGQRAVRPAGQEEGKAGEDVAALGMVVGHTTLHTEAGAAIETDVQFWTTGASGVNTAFLASAFGGAIDPATRRIRVNTFFQIEGTANAFAIGDIAALPVPEQFLGYYAGMQAEAVAANIRLLIRGKALKAYAPHPYFMAVTLGPRDGVAQGPMVMGGTMVGMIKSKKLFVDKYWGQLKAGKPPAPAPAPVTNVAL